MTRASNLILASLILIGLASAVRAATPTFIENADGKRVLALDDPALGNANQAVTDVASGKTLFYIHGKEILKDIHDPATLVVDDSTVRHTSAGLILAKFDGENVVHGRGGAVIMNYHHPDLNPSFGANRVYRVVGPALSKSELVAVLYALKPEQFKLTAEEEAAQKKDIAEAEAEDARLAAADPFAAKSWDVLSGSGPVEKISGGTIAFSAKKSGAYAVTYDHTKKGGPTWGGVAIYKELKGDKFLFSAYGTPKTIGLAVYEIKGGTLEGTWYPWYIDGDAKNIGSEVLKGPETLDGEYKIESAKAPFTGAAYTGTVTIKPAAIVGANDSAKPYLITWTIGASKIQGIGIRTKNFLFVSSGTGADVNIAEYELNNGSIQGDWYKLGSTEKGIAAATN